MVALNFRKQFADLVKAGQKKQTIRAMRKRRFVEGDILQLYTGMRTRNCTKLISPDPICCEALTIKILGAFGPVHLKQGSEWVVLSPSESEKLAKDDGFRSLVDMLIFFEETHGFPFVGQLIKW